MSKIIRLSKKNGYKTSRDYERLFELMQESAVVCFVDYGENCRDIASTACDNYPSYFVNARGTGYVTAFNQADFIKQCKQIDLEYIEPPVQPEEKYGIHVTGMDEIRGPYDSEREALIESNKINKISVEDNNKHSDIVFVVATVHQWDDLP